jgi:hypothetical protein
MRNEAVRALKPSCIKAGGDAAIEALFPRARAHRRRSQSLGAERRAPREPAELDSVLHQRRTCVILAARAKDELRREGACSQEEKTGIGDRAPGCLRWKSATEL